MRQQKVGIVRGRSRDNLFHKGLIANLGVTLASKTASF
jgi:hypothetical protein